MAVDLDKGRDILLHMPRTKKELAQAEWEAKMTRRSVVRKYRIEKRINLHEALEIVNMLGVAYEKEYKPGIPYKGRQ